MMTSISTKVTENIFCYHMVGMNRNIVYDKSNGYLFIAEIPVIQSELQKEFEAVPALEIIYENRYNIQFEDFTRVAITLYMERLCAN